MENDKTPVRYKFNIVIRYTIMGAVGIINCQETHFFFFSKRLQHLMSPTKPYKV